MRFKANAEDPTQILPLKKWLRRRRQALISAGVTEIVATYSGSGDEGNFEGIELVGSGGVPRGFPLPSRVAGLIEALVDELSPPNYEDGEGGGGELRLKVEDATILHESYEFVIERSSHGEETY